MSIDRIWGLVFAYLYVGVVGKHLNLKETNGCYTMDITATTYLIKWVRNFHANT